MREIVKILCGSHLYGTNVPESDKDYKAVFIPDAQDILLQKVKDGTCRKTEEGDLELFSLQQFLRLACQGQTNAMDMLFAPEEFYVGRPQDEWLAILNNRTSFLSKNCTAFVGYCRQQVAKYVVKRERMLAMDAVVSVLLNAEAMPCIDGPARLGDLRLDHLLDLNNPFIEIVEKETAHGAQLSHLSVCDLMVPLTASVKTALDTYERKSREYGERMRKAQSLNVEDWKSVYHAVRVAYEAIELMETGKLIFPRPEKELLLAIRTGRLPYETVSNMIEDNLAKVEDAVAASKLPEKPDYLMADHLVELFYGREVLKDMPR